MKDSVTPTIQQQAAFWDEWVMRSFQWETYAPNERAWIFMERAIRDLQLPSVRSLDVGCGSGWLTRKLNEYGPATGIDLSEKAIALLQKDYPAIPWQHGDILSLPDLGQFDVVTCCMVIAHVPDQEAFAKRLASLVKPGGLLLLTSQNSYIMERTSWLEPVAPGQIRNWPTRERLVQLFGNSFELQPITTLGHGGDRGVPRLVNNRIANLLGGLVYGAAGWYRWREVHGFGQSLFLEGVRQ